MNKLVEAVLLIVVSFESLLACSVVEIPLRKQFRNANAVFVGKVVNFVDSYKPNEIEKRSIPSDWRDGYWKDKDIYSKVKIEITKKWKGAVEEQKEFIAIGYFICVCSQKQSSFKVGEEYLFFSESEKFVAICDSHETKFDSTKSEIKNLDSFGFRLWARIYPF